MTCVTDTASPGTQPIAEQRRRSGLGPPPRVSTVVLAGAATVLTVLVAAAWAPLMTVDDAVVRALNPLMVARPGLVGAVGVVTDAGSEPVVQMLTGVAVVGALLVRRYRVAAYVLVCWLVEYVVENGIEHLVGRPRPVLPAELADVDGGSFPSGHTMGATVIAVSMVVVLVGLWTGAGGGFWSWPRRWSWSPRWRRRGCCSARTSRRTWWGPPCSGRCWRWCSRRSRACRAGAAPSRGRPTGQARVGRRGQV